MLVPAVVLVKVEETIAYGLVDPRSGAVAASAGTEPSNNAAHPSANGKPLRVSCLEEDLQTLDPRPSGGMVDLAI